MPSLPCVSVIVYHRVIQNGNWTGCPQWSLRRTTAPGPDGLERLLPNGTQQPLDLPLRVFEARLLSFFLVNFVLPVCTSDVPLCQDALRFLQIAESFALGTQLLSDHHGRAFRRDGLVPQARKASSNPAPAAALSPSRSHCGPDQDFTSALRSSLRQSPNSPQYSTFGCDLERLQGSSWDFKRHLGRRSIHFLTNSIFPTGSHPTLSYQAMYRNQSPNE